MKLPRLRLSSVMLGLVLVAVNLALLRALFGDPGPEDLVLTLGVLPMVSALASGVFVGFGRLGSRPFIRGFDQSSRRIEFRSTNASSPANFPRSMRTLIADAYDLSSRIVTRVPVGNLVGKISATPLRPLFSMLIDTTQGYSVHLADGQSRTSPTGCGRARFSSNF